MDRTRRRRVCDSLQWLRCIRQKQRPRQMDINDPPHCLLQEIMEKVNHPESKGRCRLVCKLWRSLIPDETHNLTVWKLKDYEGGEWVLDQRVYFKDMVSELPELQHYVCECVNIHESHDKYHMRIGHEVEPLACHPCNTHVIYMSFPSSIISCNLLTKTLKLVSKRHVPRSLHKYVTAVPISALLQPTPVPRFPRNGPNRH